MCIRDRAALLGMIPEGLVLLTSVALAVGSINLAKRKTLVQELYCIETLARVDTLCLDKTGTITEGNMRVESIISYAKHPYAAEDILANMMEVLDDDNSTAMAIRKYIKGKSNTFTCIEKLSFSSARKLSAVTFKENGTYVLGAYEFVNGNQNAALQKEIAEMCIRDRPRPSSSTQITPSFSIVIFIVSPKPFNASSMELSTISQTK